MRLPELFTARYFAEGVLSSGAVVPVRISLLSPRELGIELPYELTEKAHTLTPGMVHGEWSDLSPSYWRSLDRVGVEAIAEELRDISARHDGLPLALCGFEDVMRPGKSLRSVFAAWFEERTGQAVPELLDDGREIPVEEIHPRNRPARPVKPGDRRITDSEHVTDWPLSEDDFRRWVSSRHWQQAKSPGNPHEYSVRSWTTADSRMFALAVLHVRERGEIEKFGKTEFVHYRIDGFKYWSMGDPVFATFILNRKEVAEDEDAGERREPDLFDGEDTGR